MLLLLLLLAPWSEMDTPVPGAALRTGDGPVMLSKLLLLLVVVLVVMVAAVELVPWAARAVLLPPLLLLLLLLLPLEVPSVTLAAAADSPAWWPACGNTVMAAVVGSSRGVNASTPTTSCPAAAWGCRAIMRISSCCFTLATKSAAAARPADSR
jgi:hypothetical protein